MSHKLLNIRIGRMNRTEFLLCAFVVLLTNIVAIKTVLAIQISLGLLSVCLLTPAFIARAHDLNIKDKTLKSFFIFIALPPFLLFGIIAYSIATDHYGHIFYDYGFAGVVIWFTLIAIVLIPAVIIFAISLFLLCGLEGNISDNEYGSPSSSFSFSRIIKVNTIQ